MGTRIDQTEQRDGRVSEVSGYNTLLLMFDIIIPWPTNLLCCPCYKFRPLEVFDKSHD